MTAPFSGDDLSGDENGDGESVWDQLRVWFFSPPRIPTQRLEALDRAIESDPDGASNYVLRGELRLQIGDYAGAAEDYERALTMAAQQYEQDDWGLLSQVLRDQAEMGLDAAQRKLKRKRA